MAKAGNSITVGLVCTICKRRNYLTKRNKVNTPEKLLMKKFCNSCRKVTDHKENDKLK